MKKQSLFAASVVTIFMAGCANSNDPTVKSTNASSAELGISVKVSSTTRSAIDAFSANDSVGIFVDGTTAGTYTSKIASYTYDGSSWNGPSGSTSKIYLTGQTASVYGFYPDSAMSSVSLSTKTLECHIPSVQNFTASQVPDYLYGSASASDVAGALTFPTVSSLSSTSNQASLYFHHALSKVTFVVNKSSSYPSGTQSGIVTNVVLRAYTDGTLSTLQNRFSIQGSLDLSTGIYTASSVSTQISDSLSLQSSPGVAANEYAATASTTPISYGLFAPCGDLSNVTVSFTVDGKVMSKTLTTATVSSWSSGYNYVYTVTVQPKELQIVSCQIVPWNTSSEDIGTVN